MAQAMRVNSIFVRLFRVSRRDVCLITWNGENYLHFLDVQLAKEL